MSSAACYTTRDCSGTPALTSSDPASTDAVAFCSKQGYNSGKAYGSDVCVQTKLQCFTTRDCSGVPKGPDTTALTTYRTAGDTDYTAFSRCPTGSVAYKDAGSSVCKPTAGVQCMMNLTCTHPYAANLSRDVGACLAATGTNYSGPPIVAVLDNQDMTCRPIFRCYTNADCTGDNTFTGIVPPVGADIVKACGVSAVSGAPAQSFADAASGRCVKFTDAFAQCYASHNCSDSAPFAFGTTTDPSSCPAGALGGFKAGATAAACRPLANLYRAGSTWQPATLDAAGNLLVPYDAQAATVAVVKAGDGTAAHEFSGALPAGAAVPASPAWRVGVTYQAFKNSTCSSTSAVLNPNTQTNSFPSLSDVKAKSGTHYKAVTTAKLVDSATGEAAATLLEGQVGACTALPSGVRRLDEEPQTAEEEEAGPEAEGEAGAEDELLLLLAGFELNLENLDAMVDMAMGDA